LSNELFVGAVWDVGEGALKLGGADVNVEAWVFVDKEDDGCERVTDGCVDIAAHGCCVAHEGHF